MPVRRMKRGERPSKPGERNTAINHWIFLDICWVIESDELMPNHLRINRECNYGQTERDEEIGSPECCSVAEHDTSSVRHSNATNFSLSRCSFSHAVCETTRARTTGIPVVSKAFELLCRPACIGDCIRLQPTRLPLQ